MAIDAADITPGWYWVVDPGFLYDPSIVFVTPVGNDELVVLHHHGAEHIVVLSKALERYEFVVRIEKPDFSALLPKEALKPVDLTAGWYWVVDRGFPYDPSIVFLQPVGNDELVVLFHGVEYFAALSDVLERYEFVVQIEKPDFRALLPKEALELMDLEIDWDTLEIIDVTTDLPQDGHPRLWH